MGTASPETKRAWRLANPEKVRAQKQRSYVRHKERISAERKAQGGEHSYANTRPAHLGCNHKRGVQPWVM